MDKLSILPRKCGKRTNLSGNFYRRLKKSLLICGIAFLAVLFYTVTMLITITNLYYSGGISKWQVYH